MGSTDVDMVLGRTCAVPEDGVCTAGSSSTGVPTGVAISGEDERVEGVWKIGGRYLDGVPWSGSVEKSCGRPVTVTVPTMPMSRDEDLAWIEPHAFRDLPYLAEEAEEGGCEDLGVVGE
jgi:hypothetical protein